MQITWNNKPSFDSCSLDSTIILKQTARVLPSWYSWTVTSTCQTALKNTNKLLTFILVGEKTFESLFEEANYLSPFFDSRETSNPPKLTITYEEPSEPEQPTDSEEKSLLPFNLSMEMLFWIVAIIAVVIVGVVAYKIGKRKNKSVNDMRTNSHLLVFLEKNKS